MTARETVRETVRGENPQVPARLLDDLLWTVQCGAFGPEVDTAYSRALMAGTLHFTEALLDLAGQKAGLLRYPHERDVLDRTEAREALTLTRPPILLTVVHPGITRLTTVWRTFS
ncbi:hypothetical protein SD235_11725 [Burkholderia cepacia]|uniref:hypothetical protein n=1 Tax=Burkholderia cepacia TaxID=292 RepID=UPI003A4DA32A